MPRVPVSGGILRGGLERVTGSFFLQRSPICCGCGLSVSILWHECVWDRFGALREIHARAMLPNPFNPSTTIRYGLSDRTLVRLIVFDALGQQVSVLQNGEQDSGYHEVGFDARNLPSGLYFYRLQAGDFVETRRLVLLSCEIYVCEGNLRDSTVVQVRLVASQAIEPPCWT
jgi:hypothetical protein